MKKLLRLNLKKLKYVSVTFVLLLIFSNYFSGQTPEGNHNPSLCSYIKQEKIFVGVFQKQTYKKGGNGKEGFQIAEFSIKRALKGIDQNKNKISAISGVYTKELQVGETYLVFLIENKTAKSDEITAPFPIVFFDKNLTKGAKREKSSRLNGFQIAFFDFFTDVSNLKYLEPFKIQITSNNKIFSPKFTNSAVFVIVFHSDDVVSVSMELPSFPNAFFTYSNNPIYEMKTESDRTFIKYELKGTDWDCDYRQFNQQ